MGTPLRNRYFTTIGSSSVKRLQIDTDLLRIITSTADELSEGTNFDDLERDYVIRRLVSVHLIPSGLTVFLFLFAGE